MLIVTVFGVSAFFDGSKWQSEDDWVEDVLNLTLVEEPIDVSDSYREGGLYHTARNRAKQLDGLKVTKFQPPPMEEVEGVDA